MFKLGVTSNFRLSFTFNGKESINEISGSGNDLDFGARMYDPRIGRWLSLDPLQSKYPDLSPFNFTMNNPILFIDPDGKIVTIKDVASYQAVLGTLTASEIARININKDGTIAISGVEAGSTNLENLRILVDSKVNHNIITTGTYKSAAGTDVKLPNNVSGRTLFPEDEATELGLDKSLASPSEDVNIIIKPTTEDGAPQVLAHEAFGHAVLGEKRRKGEAVNPCHDFGPNGERNEDFKVQGWGAVSSARGNYKQNSSSLEWNIIVDKKISDFKMITTDTGGNSGNGQEQSSGKVPYENGQAPNEYSFSTN